MNNRSFTGSKFKLAGAALALAVSAVAAGPLAPLGPEPPVPAFSISYMDPSISPGADFYSFANGRWAKDNPVPADKMDWDGGGELHERNSYLIHALLEEAAAGHYPRGTPRRQVGDFYASAMDTNRLEQLRFKPIAANLKRIDRLNSTDDLFRLLAWLHDEGMDAIFRAAVAPDPRQASVYALQLEQGGLSLPDRDYYLKESFATNRQDFCEHVAKMFALLGEKPDAAATHAGIVLDLETELARDSAIGMEIHNIKTNYIKCTRAELLKQNRAIPWQSYLSERGLAKVPCLVVGHPVFFKGVDKLVAARPLLEWRVYLRWCLLDDSASFLFRDVLIEHFNFYNKLLGGPSQPRPRWKHALEVLDIHIGEAVGQLFVEKYFRPEAKARMNDLVENLKAVFRERLQKVNWMTEPTRAKALAKFDRFTLKIGYPDKFRDYSAIKIKRDDYLGNIRRARVFNEHREIARVGQLVDRTEWSLSPQTVDAHSVTPLNEIVVPASILQPPYFDLTKDDAVNYGAIGTLIGHEMTHGYDVQGCMYDADGNRRQWWTEQEFKEFEARFEKVVDQYNAFEPLPGLHVNGEMTVFENLADLGGVRIAYDALQRALARDPSKRKRLDGFTPEQRFFISFAQSWRTNIRETAARDQVKDDHHAPGRFRAVGPLVNLQEFFDVFNIKPGDPMWRAPEQRAHLW